MEQTRKDQTRPETESSRFPESLAVYRLAEFYYKRGRDSLREYRRAVKMNYSTICATAICLGSTTRTSDRAFNAGAECHRRQRARHQRICDLE